MWLYVTQCQRPASVLMAFEMYMLLLAGASWWLDELRYDNVRVNSWRDQHGNTIRIIKNVNVSRVQLILWLQQNSPSITSQWCHGTHLSLPLFLSAPRKFTDITDSNSLPPLSARPSMSRHIRCHCSFMSPSARLTEHTKQHKSTRPLCPPGDVISAYLVTSTIHTSE